MTIYEIRGNKKLKKISQCAFCGYFSSLLRCVSFGWIFFFYGNNFFNVGQKRDHNFSPSSGVLYAAAAAERDFLLLRQWKHLLRRFTDCEQLGLSSRSTFWFSASSAAQECIGEKL